MNRKLGATSLIVGLLVSLTSIWGAARRVGTGSVRAEQIREEPSRALVEKSALPSPDGVHPVFKLADVESMPAQEASYLLEQSYARQALALYQYVKNYLACQPAGDHSTALEPTYVLLGDGGGYAKQGFWLEDGQGQLIDRRGTSYVGGLPMGEGYLGDFEQIFPHELGHVMLQELSGWQRGTLAAQIHQVTMGTDYVYAFNEGWGEHFQAVAVDHTNNAGLRAQADRRLFVGEEGPYSRLARELKGRCVLCPAKLSLMLWFSQRESHLRYAGVKSNLFAHQPSVPEELLRGGDRNDALLYQAVIPPTEADPPKNGSHMLACEGVAAGLFYRLVNGPRLQQSYREPSFYEQFLPPGKVIDWSSTSPPELFSPMENVYLKLFRVFAEHVRLDGDPLGESPAIQLVRGYVAEYPDEAVALYDAFLEITHGVTVEPEALRRAENRSSGGLSSAEHKVYLEDLRRRLLAGQVELDSALGSQIWLRNGSVQVGITVMDVYRSLPRPYHFNLNAATVVDLRTVAGVDVELARRIVQMRDEQAGFDSLEDLADVAGVTPEIVDRFRSMQGSMQEWLEQEMGNPEDELNVETLVLTVVRSLLWRILLGVAVTSGAAGVILGAGRFLEGRSARRLGLEGDPSAQACAVGGMRKALGRVARVLLVVVLPVTVFFLLQALLIAFNGREVSGVAFAFELWLSVTLPYLGWRVFRRGLSRRAALHSAAWTLAVYVAMFVVVGWLMGT